MPPYERSTSSSLATARARSRSASATATSFACGTARARFSACRCPITPTPHTATFNRATGASFEQLDDTGAPEQCQAAYLFFASHLADFAMPLPSAPLLSRASEETVSWHLFW